MFNATSTTDVKSPRSAQIFYLPDYMTNARGGESWQRETARLYDSILPVCGEPRPRIPPDLAAGQHHCHLSLEINSHCDEQPDQMIINPTAFQIHQRVRALSWQQLTFVTLRPGAGQWLQICGSHTLGFAALCRVEGTEYVTQSAPESLDILIRLLQSYADKDGVWRTLVQWCE